MVVPIVPIVIIVPIVCLSFLRSAKLLRIVSCQDLNCGLSKHLSNVHISVNYLVQNYIGRNWLVRLFFCKTILGR